MSAQHTPGPWSVTSEIDRIFNGELIRPGKPEERNTPVAVVCDFNRFDRDDERKANARLIAAAPDLLAACEAALSDGPEHFAVAKQLQAAIARATGGAS